MASFDQRDFSALLFGAGLVAVPLVAGGGLGLLLRRVRARSKLAGFGVMLVVLAMVWVAAIVVMARSVDVGAWDWLNLSLLTSIGFLAVGFTSKGAWTRGRIIGLTIVSLAPLLLLDVALRFVAHDLPSYPPPRDARWVQYFTNRDPPCHSIFPGEFSAIRQYADAPKNERRILHVGDSMVFGLSIERGQEFPALLEKAMPGTKHINPSQPGAGPDAYLLIAQKWQEATKADEVFVYFFLGNDVADLNRDYLCCDCGPLLDYSTDPPTPRCTTEKWRVPTGMLLSTSPAPYPLRVAASFSTLAAFGTRAFDQLDRKLGEKQLFSADFDTSPQEALDKKFERAERILKTLQESMKARNVPLTLVVLPFRGTLELALGKTPQGVAAWPSLEEGLAAHRRVVALGQKLGIHVIDPYEALKARAAERGTDALFAHDYPGDVHFSAEGHEWMAKFLLPELQKSEASKQ